MVVFGMMMLSLSSKYYQVSHAMALQHCNLLTVGVDHTLARPLCRYRQWHGVCAFLGHGIGLVQRTAGNSTGIGDMWCSCR